MKLFSTKTHGLLNVGIGLFELTATLMTEIESRLLDQSNSHE
jgi:hypothetical protein